MKRLRIHEHFVTLQDPRIERTKRHALMDVVVIAILAVIAGADGWDDIEQFADARSRWLKTFLALRGGVPCADTFRRVFAALDAEEFQRCVLGWMCELADGLSGKLVAIDGKTARGSFGDGRGPLHLVSAWVAENSLALAQIAVEDKSNEIVAIPRLLALLDLRGATVTIDAMGCQKAIAAAIVDRGADYVLALKDNHPTLHAEVAEFFADAEKSGWRDTPHSSDETTDGGHGRVEVRRVWASDEIEWLDPKGAWKGLRSIVMVERERVRPPRLRSPGLPSRQRAPAGGVRHRAEVRPPPGRDLATFHERTRASAAARGLRSRQRARSRFSAASPGPRTANREPRTPAAHAAPISADSSSPRDCSIFRCAGPCVRPSLGEEDPM